MELVNIDEKFTLFSELWAPKIVAELNGQEVKLVKAKGTFPWHCHEHEEEMFLVWRGELRVEFRDHLVVLRQGDILVVPRGIEHRTAADEEVEILVFEPAGVRNTGNVEDATFSAPIGARI